MGIDGLNGIKQNNSGGSKVSDNSSTSTEIAKENKRADELTVIIMDPNASKAEKQKAIKELATINQKQAARRITTQSIENEENKKSQDRQEERKRTIPNSIFNH